MIKTLQQLNRLRSEVYNMKISQRVFRNYIGNPFSTAYTHNAAIDDVIVAIDKRIKRLKEKK